MLEDPLSLVGTTVSEKYEIERVVGEGGFALVYRAKHTVWQRPVALKVFRALGDLPASKRVGLLEAFIQEGRLLAELSERSAAICQARDVGTLKTPDGREMPYMVLEWLEGRSLEQVTEAEKAAQLPPRTPEQVVRLLEPAAEALALAHRKGIAHRDVKPANIFVIGEPRGEFTVKILDFGIAKVVQDAQRIGGSFQQTAGHVSSFTPAYGAPEQFSRTQGSTGPWTDVFSLALIFTELMTHRGALVGDDLTQLAYSSMDPRRRPTPRTHGAAIPDPLEAVLRRAVAVDTAERFPTMGAFWEAVRAALGLEALRAFSSVDSARSSSPSHVSIHSTSLAPQVPISAHAVSASVGPRSVSPMPSPVANVTGPPVAPFAHTTQPRSQRDGTLRASGQVTVPAPATGRGGLGLALGAIGLILLLGAVSVTLLTLRKAAKAPIASTSASASSSAVPIAPPPATCPSGMVKIDSGKFFMGSDDKNDEPEERPAHQVTLSPYCIDVTEVTVEAYKACSDRGGCKRAPRENDFPGIDAAAHKLYDPLCNIRDPEGRAKHPINCVDWDLADFYCKAEGKRLPTEAEWEYATRGSDGRKYPWGDDAPTSGQFLNACGSECVGWGKKNNDPYIGLKPMYPANDGFETTAPVGSFPKGASKSGVQDVVGNVWEWVSDWKAPYAVDAQVDPKGPATGETRIVRGGSWNGTDPAWVRPSYRFGFAPTMRSHGVGMRCAKSFGDDAGASR